MNRVCARVRRLRFVFILVLLGLLTACSGASDKSSSAEISSALSVTGSVGDGPIVLATITAEDVNGTVILTETGSDTANYQFAVPDGALMPVTIRANGGTDLVTGRAADFELIAVATSSGTQTINISPLTTLAFRTAECSAGGVSAVTLQNAWTIILSEVAMGLDASRVSDPMADPVTEANIETVVLANEALGEVVRRTEMALTSAGFSTSGDEVFRQLGCDLASPGGSALDGVGTSVDSRVISTFRSVEAAVLLEVIAGRLEVDGQDATVLMDGAIRTVLPSSAPDVAGMAITSGVVDQVRQVLAILQGVYPDAELITLAILLDETAPTQLRASVDASLDSATHVVLNGLADRVANADSTEIDLLTSRMQAQEQAPPPIVSIDAMEVTVIEGASTMLSWASVNADQCIAAGGWAGFVALEGTDQTDPLTTDTTFSLSCAGNGGTTTQSVTVSVTESVPPPDPDPIPEPPPPPAPPPPAPPEPSVSFSAAPLTIENGQTSTLNWSSQNASSCTASGGWSGVKGTSGSETVGPLMSDTTFTLSCSGSGGTASSTAAVTVNAFPQPTMSLSAASTAVDSGDSTTLTWSSQNASNCTASGGWSGVKGTSGSETVGPLTTDTTFTLSCSGNGGTASSATTVLVNALPAPTLSLSAAATSVDSGSSTSLTWNSQNADSCTASNGWSGNKATSGTEAIGPITTNTTYTLTCTGAGGNAVSITSVSINGALQLSWAAPTQNVDGSALTNLAGFRIYYGTQPGIYSDSVDVNNAGATQQNLSVPVATYHVVITAIDANGSESAYSNTVTKTAL